MTNEEKSKQLINSVKTTREFPSLIQAIIAEELVAMAEWKDQQFKEYLEKKSATLKGYSYRVTKLFILESINELFKEDTKIN